mgnify:CR=1 FL=1
MTKAEKLAILTRFTSRQSATHYIAEKDHYYGWVDLIARLDARYISCSDFDSEKSDDAMVLHDVPYSSFSDYSGRDVERSNFRLLKEGYFSKCKELIEYYGDYGTTGLLILEQAIPDCPTIDTEEEYHVCNCSSCELFEAIQGLENYPAIDDEDVGRVEYELRDEAWESYGRSDFRSALHGRFPTLEATIDDLSKEDLDKLYYEADSHGNPCHEIETGGIVCFHFDRLLKDYPPPSLVDAEAYVESQATEPTTASLQCPKCASGHLQPTLNATLECPFCRYVVQLV